MTTKEFLALLLRRADPSRLQLIFGSDGTVDGELGAMLGQIGQVAAAGVEPPMEPDAPAALLRGYLDSDCISDDPAQQRAYQLASPVQRAAGHDRRADELLVQAGWGDTVGALAYHCEHGSDPAGRGRQALLKAQQLCVEIGFSAMVVELGHRGRAVTDSVQEHEAFCRFTMQAAAALVPLGDLDGSLQLYRDLRRRYSLPKIQMVTDYAIAMLYTRFFTPRDHEQAVEWQNNAIALAAGLPDARDRIVFGVFQDNALALIEMHRGNLGQAPQPDRGGHKPA